MMVDKEFVICEDKKLQDNGILLHNRPWYVSNEWLKQQGIVKNLTNCEELRTISEIYQTLYPDDEFSSPQSALGGVYLQGTIYPVTRKVFGTLKVPLWKWINISEQYYNQIIQRAPEEIREANESINHINSFHTFFEGRKNEPKEANDLWLQTKNYIFLSANTLHSNAGLHAAVPNICFIAESAMKGAMAYLGVSEKERIKLQHNLVEISNSLIERCPYSAHDDQLKEYCQQFPNYTDSRYKPSDLNKTEISKLLIKAQFIAATSIQRLN